MKMSFKRESKILVRIQEESLRTNRSVIHRSPSSLSAAASDSLPPIQPPYHLIRRQSLRNRTFPGAILSRLAGNVCNGSYRRQGNFFSGCREQGQLRRNYMLYRFLGGCNSTFSDNSPSKSAFLDCIHDKTYSLERTIYAWVGCNSAKLGHLYAAAPTRPNNTVSVSSILGGASDNTGSSMARHLVLRIGLNVILACNIPKNNPMIEAGAEKKLMEKLINLGYTKPRLTSK